MTTATAAPAVARLDLSSAETMRVLVLSTAHVQEATARKIEGGDWGPAAMLWKYGWLIYTDIDGLDWEDEAPELAHVLASAKAAGIEWVRFDCDADRLDGLPTWEW